IGVGRIPRRVPAAHPIPPHRRPAGRENPDGAAHLEGPSEARPRVRGRRERRGRGDPLRREAARHAGDVPRLLRASDPRASGGPRDADLPGGGLRAVHHGHAVRQGRGGGRHRERSPVRPRRGPLDAEPATRPWPRGPAPSRDGVDQFLQTRRSGLADRGVSRLSAGGMGPKRRRGRRGRIIIMGLVLIGAGLVVFRYSAYIAGQLDSYISPPPTDGNNITGLVSPGGWYLPYAVWGFGFTLIRLVVTKENIRNDRYIRPQAAMASRAFDQPWQSSGPSSDSSPSSGSSRAC